MKISAFFQPPETTPSKAVVIAACAVMLVVSVAFCWAAVEGVADVFPRETTSVRGAISYVDTKTKTRKSRRFSRDSNTIFLANAPSGYHVPQLLLTTPSTGRLRQAKVAEIAYDKDKNVLGLVLDGETYLTPFSYQVQRGALVLVCLLLGLAGPLILLQRLILLRRNV